MHANLDILPVGVERPELESAGDDALAARAQDEGGHLEGDGWGLAEVELDGERGVPRSI